MQETSRICSKCLTTKPIEEFYKGERFYNNGYSYLCKSCSRARGRAYYAKTKKYIKKIPETEKPCLICNIIKPINDFYCYLKENRHSSYCKACDKEKKKKYYQQNIQKITEKHKKYRINNKDAISAQHKKYRQENREIILQKSRQKRLSMTDEQRKNENLRASRYRKHKKANDVNFRIKIRLRKRLQAELKGKNKYKSTLALLGCSIPELKTYLELKFQDGMTWDNYGFKGWHIDHIRPCASFDLCDPEQQKQCFHFTNLQPLWAKDNLRKGASMSL